MPEAPHPPIPRTAFELPPERLWLAHCVHGMLPRASAQAMTRLLRMELQPWVQRWQEDFLDIQQRLREAGAALLGVHAADMSLVTCTSTGLGAVAQGYPWAAGDEVLIPAGEFPSNRLPWLALAARGVSCREIELWEGQIDGRATAPSASVEPERRLLAAITPATRLIAVSWVRFQDGLMLDLGKLGRACRERGIALIVDGIQGAGTAVPELADASAFVAGGQKGLLGLQGQGLLWTRADFRARLAPLGTWLALPVEAPAGVPAAWVADGRRLEAGSPSIVNCRALLESIRLLLESGGASCIQEHVRTLQQDLLARLRTEPAWADEALRLSGLLEAGRLGSVLSFHAPALDLPGLLARGTAQGIHASLREGYLRIGLHGWHSRADVERAAGWMISVRRY